MYKEIFYLESKYFNFIALIGLSMGILGSLSQSKFIEEMGKSVAYMASIYLLDSTCEEVLLTRRRLNN